MNKQEAIEIVERDKIQLGRIKEINSEANTIQQKIELVDYVSLETVIKIFDKISEPQKVTVSMFVAEWIEASKKCHNNLSWVWFSNPACDELNDWLKNHTETFMRAWLDGYEVETEKLYTVEIPNPNSNWKYTVLVKKDNRGVLIYKTDDDCWKADKRNQLTESEIKQDFEWAWQFSKEVE